MVLHPTELDRRSKTGEQDVGVLRTQDFFGERALINNEPRAANIVATEQLECLVLDRVSFQTPAAGVPGVLASWGVCSDVANPPGGSRTSTR